MGQRRREERKDVKPFVHPEFEEVKAKYRVCTRECESVLDKKTSTGEQIVEKRKECQTMCDEKMPEMKIKKMEAKEAAKAARAAALEAAKAAKEAARAARETEI